MRRASGTAIKTAMTGARVNSEYLGESRGVSVYQPTRALPTRWLTPQVYKCAACKVRWFRSITNWYGGLCFECWVTQFEGEEEIR